MDKSEVEYSIEVQPEDIPVKGNILASGDDAQDLEAENEVLRQLNQGNEWAWCVVRVTARYGDFEGNDYLGGCSYASKADFMKDGYYEDMKSRALENLEASIRNSHRSSSTFLTKGEDSSLRGPRH